MSKFCKYIRVEAKQCLFLTSIVGENDRERQYAIVSKVIYGYSSSNKCLIQYSELNVVIQELVSIYTFQNTL